MLPSSPSIERMLVIGPNWIGDAVMSTPTLANLRRGLPKAHIDLIVPPHVAPLFDACSSVDRVLIRDDRQPWRSRLAQAMGLRRHNYQVVLLLPNSFRAALYAWLIGSPARVGYATDGRRWLLSHALPVSTLGPCHQVEAYLQLLTVLHLPIVERVPVLFPSAQAEQAAAAVWQAQGWETEAIVIGICPGAAYGVAKRWWPERFAALADRLIGAGKFRVVFFGGHGEVSLVDRILSQMTHAAASLAGQDTLGLFAALAARCAVMISNDSGAMHIASAVGTRVVALFGPTDPQRTAPISAPASILRHSLACSPCFRTICPYADHPCMRLIEVDEVYQAVLESLR